MRKSPDHTQLPILIKTHNLYKYGSHYQVIILALSACIVFLSFSSPNTVDMIPQEKDPFAYDLENPDTKLKLPDYLEEISGLSYYGKGKIACVQDEKAHIYILNLEKEKIINKYKFGDDADYEDISVVDKTAYILRNNGHIYRIWEFGVL